MYRFAIASSITAACTAFGGSPAVCGSLKRTIPDSYGGNTGKRGGLICKLMGSCQPDKLANCSIDSTVGLAAAALDLCTVEGIANGSRVSGIDADAGDAACRGADLDFLCMSCVCAKGQHRWQSLMLGLVQQTAARC